METTSTVASSFNPNLSANVADTTTTSKPQNFDFSGSHQSHYAASSQFQQPVSTKYLPSYPSFISSPQIPYASSSHQFCPSSSSYPASTPSSFQPTSVPFQGLAQARIATPDLLNNLAWFLDSSATNHVTHDHHNLMERSSFPGTEQILMGNGQGGAVGMISVLMLIEANNVEQQEKKRCKYCHGTGYLACARCSASGVCLNIDPISVSSASVRPLEVPTTRRCPNCSGAGKVMCPTCLCTGMLMASEHDLRIDPFD